MSSASPRDPVHLGTGPLTAELVDGALRDVRVAGHLALDAVYAAVRGPAWETLPGRVSSLEVERNDDGFTVGFVCDHRPALRWRGRLTGRAGQVTFDFDGEMLEELAANRIGFCLLHPIELAGRPVLARTVHGEHATRFPDRISPHQPLLDLVGLGYQVAAGARVDLSLEGEMFEMEDHRNWTDAGFKTYCTPLRRPHPVVHRKGDRIRQTVRITARAAGPVAPPPEPTLAIRVGGTVVGRLPQLGAGVPAPPHGPRLAHVYAEATPTAEGAAELAGAAAEAAALGTALDVAMLAPAGTPADDVAAHLAGVRTRIGRVSMFDADRLTTPPGAAPALRAALRRRGIEAPVGGGSRANFAELNRMRLVPAELDFVSYGIDALVHHDDAQLVMDTLLAQPHTVRDAHRIGQGRPVVVRPVRATTPAGTSPASGFLAAWTLGSVAALTGAAAVTYDTGDSAHPILAALAGLADEPVYAVQVPPRELAALAVGRLLLVANLRPTPRVVRIADRPTELGPYAVTVVER